MVHRVTLNFQRTFSSSLISRSSYFARSILNPKNYKIVPPEKFIPKSLILLTTPTRINDVINQSIEINQEKDVQVAVACVDAVLPNGYRNGIAEMWLDDYVEIEDSTLLEAVDNNKNRKHGAFSSRMRSEKDSWRIIPTSFSIGLSGSDRINLSLANTVFSTGQLATMFFLQPKGFPEQPNHGQTLCELQITIRNNVFGTSLDNVVKDRWIPLRGSDEEPLVVTSCVGNLIKEINGQSASRFLSDNKKLMDLQSKDTEIYLKLYKKDLKKAERFKVIAGGGEWGAKANILAITPLAKLEKGDRLEFYMISPTEKFTLNDTPLKELQHTLTFECVPEELMYSEEYEGESQVLPDIFGGGSEKGFSYNGILHESPGELLSVKL